jgi:hypothetical protein
MNCLLSYFTPTALFKESSDVSTAVEDKADAMENEELLLCRQCRQIITRATDQISVNGANRHVFANPHGIVYEIGCFRAVTGCGYAGGTSTEFTWFAGYAWRILACTGCLSHLGWAFTENAGDRFYGLILDRKTGLLHFL